MVKHNIILRERMLFFHFLLLPGMTDVFLGVISIDDEFFEGVLLKPIRPQIFAYFGMN